MGGVIKVFTRAMGMGGGSEASRMRRLQRRQERLNKQKEIRESNLRKQQLINESNSGKTKVKLGGVRRDVGTESLMSSSLGLKAKDTGVQV